MTSGGTCCSCSFQDVSYLPGTCAASFVMFMSLVDTLFRSRCDITEACHRVGRDDLEVDGAEFDFIVVGAGVAGPVVTGRLTENPDWNVLLLEAGPEEPTTTQLPAFAVSALHTELDWNYTTVAQQNACLNNGGVCRWPRGKMVSGTGSMHGMMYTRGHRSIYDHWAALGNTGWSYDEVLPYFMKAERNGNLEELDPGYHGESGPMPVEHYPNRPPLAEAVVAAGAELGYSRSDLNGANQTGINIAQMMVYQGLRASTPRMYLRPHSDRKNLYVAINSHVTKIIVDNSAFRAKGVQFVDKYGKKKTVFASKEVIISAGAIGSPHILLLSGIGPSEDLEGLGIPVVADLPVGKNLHNHVSVGLNFFINETNEVSLTMEAINEFLRTRTGPLSSTGLTQSTGFFLSKYAKDGVPDLQVFFDGYSAHCAGTGLSSECSDGSINTKCGRRSIYSRPTNVLPRSVGHMKLSSANPFDYPLINPRYLSDPHDVDVLVEGIKLLINMTKTEALKPWGFQMDTTVVKGCEGPVFASDEYWACVVRRNTGPENHPGGSCRMGPAGDAQAVVDPRLRVHGILNIRVVDASVFPYMPNSNPVAAIIAAAEKCADMIKEDWNNESYLYGVNGKNKNKLTSSEKTT
ncbi:glucose dehydrogenase [FAD, quinone]-like [Anabrus simplex]|uniref:glucose dehydrogenase [FAD, quinone]-like n=1 Tax=Anabrus simplex TaxID=316456 RepID=UPI0035A309CA